MDVIKAEGYTPNIFARGLGLDSMKTIGIMCPNIADNYMARAISHLEQNFHEYGYDCILGCSGHTREAKENYVNMVEAGILDPVKVTRSALQNATSVASTLLTTESVVANIKEDVPPMPAGGGMGMM